MRSCWFIKKNRQLLFPERELSPTSPLKLAGLRRMSQLCGSKLSEVELWRRVNSRLQANLSYPVLTYKWMGNEFWCDHGIREAAESCSVKTNTHYCYFSKLLSCFHAGHCGGGVVSIPASQLWLLRLEFAFSSHACVFSFHNWVNR